MYKPQSNFLFDFITEVVCETFPQSSGFLMSVKTEGSNEAKYVVILINFFSYLLFIINNRLCYSTNDSVQ